MFQKITIIDDCGLTAPKYVGMCCSLYDEKSANVDIATARKLGIAVRDVRDYGDEGTDNGALDSNGNVYKFML